MPFVFNMNEPRGTGDGPSGGGSDTREVWRYLVKLILLMVLGAALMITVAVIAWHNYAGGLVETTRPAPAPIRR